MKQNMLGSIIVLSTYTLNGTLVPRCSWERGYYTTEPAPALLKWGGSAKAHDCSALQKVLSVPTEV